MKKFAVLSVLVFSSAAVCAQQVPSDRPTSAATTQDVRMTSLEDQVRILAEEVVLLRREVQSLREAKTPEPGVNSPSDDRILLAASHIQPDMLPAPSPSTSLSSAAPVPLPGQVTQTQTFGGASSNAKLLNPDISLIGDFIGTAGRNTVSPSPSLQLHESEIGLQAIIDPYARADAFISFGETGVNVEEGYVTFTSLPAGLLLKVGKMRADFGKVNTIHNHALPFIDRPLVTNNLIGGEDGIDDAGLSLSRFLPAPKNWFLEGTAQVFRGDSADVFQATHRQDVSVVGHLRAYRDLTESTNLDLGVSYARGHNNAGIDEILDSDRFLTNLYGADATLRWKPLRRAIYHSFLFRSEFFWSARDQLSAGNLFQTQHAFGFYSDAEYRANRRWTVGGRFDRSGHATNAHLTDTGFSAILTYWPSEFSQIRGQYRFGHLADPVTNNYSNANEFLFQFLFVMGAHGAHPF
jgi:hypothetical protein